MPRDDADMPMSQSQTPFQRKLALAAYDARVRERAFVADALNKMILAVTRGRYVELGALHASLPLQYRAMVGVPPPGRSEDQ